MLFYQGLQSELDWFYNTLFLLVLLFDDVMKEFLSSVFIKDHFPQNSSEIKNLKGESGYKYLYSIFCVITFFN